MKKNKILLIGYGKIGQKYFSILRNLNQSVYIYDTDVNVLKKKINFVDIKNTNTLKNFSHIIIATPPSSHIYYVKIAILNKIPFLVEKPLSNNIRYLNKLLSSNINFGYSVCNMRYHEGILKIKNNMNKVGNINYINCEFAFDLFKQRKIFNISNDYLFKKNQGGGMIMYIYHEFDYISWLFGKIKKISILDKEKLNPKIPLIYDKIKLKLFLEKNIIVFLNLDYISSVKIRRIEVNGKKGSLTWNSFFKNFEEINVKFFNEKKSTEKNLYFKKLNKLNSSMHYTSMLKDFIFKNKSKSNLALLSNSIKLYKTLYPLNKKNFLK